MRDNIQEAIKRGENIKIIDDKSKLLEDHVDAFNNSAKLVKKKFVWII